MCKTCSISFVLLLLCSTFLGAQPLSDRVPEEAVLYIGWAGSETLRDAYKGSNLKTILDNSKVRELFTHFFPQVAKEIIENEPDAEKPLNTVMALAPLMWKHPHALFAWLDFTDPNQPMPRGGLLCKAGKDGPALLNQIDELLAEMGETPVPVVAFQKDDLVAVLVGFDDAEKALPGAGDVRALVQNAAFASSLKQVQPNPALIFYLNTAKLLGDVEAALLASDAPEEVKQKIPLAFDASGLRGLKGIIKTAGFDGKDWMSMGFIEAPVPRTGLLSMLEPKPVSPELLKAIPVDATFVATARVDPARFINEFRTAAGKVDPRGPDFIDMGLGAVQVALARNLLNDILAPMGEDWGIYCSPTASGNGVLGFVVVNKLDDPAKAQASYPMAAVNLSNWVAVMMQQNEADVEIRGRMAKIGDLNVYYIGLPVIAPAWTMKDGYLFLGLFPQSAAGGARALAKLDGKCITDNEKFQAVQKRLGVTNPVSVSFFDLPAVASTGSLYQQWMVLCRYGGFGDLFGIPMPEPLLPPLDVLRQNLSPAGAAAWIDDAGYHSKSITPFPGAKMLSEPGLFASGAAPLGVSAFGVAILLPALHRSSETANRVRCAAHMRMIGQAIVLYSIDHQGSYPDDLGSLMQSVGLEADLFICPGSQVWLPDDFDNMTPEQMAEWINESSSFVYLGQGMKNDIGAETIVMYEKPHNHGFAGINILYGDGRIEFHRMPAAIEQLARQGITSDVPQRDR